MLKFKIFEIPEGQSKRTVQLGSEDLELGEIPFLGAEIHFDFYRVPQFIRVQFHLDAEVELVCDRSLDTFRYPVSRDYEVLYKAEKVEESADEHGAIRNFDLSSRQIDLEQDVRDTIMLDVPVKKLHPRFLDEDGNPKEFIHKQFGEIPEDEEEAVDPRWEALKELKK